MSQSLSKAECSPFRAEERWDVADPRALPWADGSLRLWRAMALNQQLYRKLKYTLAKTVLKTGSLDEVLDQVRD